MTQTKCGMNGDIFLMVADRHAPPITRKVRSEYAPWITSENKNLMPCRDFLKRKAVKTGSKQFHNAFAKERNELNKLINHFDCIKRCVGLASKVVLSMLVLLM